MPHPALPGRDPRPPHNIVAYKTALIAGGLVTFFFLLIELNEGAEGGFLDPLLLALSGVVLLWPLRHHTVVRAIFAAGGLLLGLWFFQVVGGVLAPFIAVYILAYVFNPLVTHLQEKHGVARGLSAFAVTAVFVGGVVLFFLLLVPTLIDQVSNLATDLLGTMAGLQTWVEQSKIVQYLVDNGLVDRSQLSEQLGTFLPNQIDSIAQQIPVAARGVARSVSTVLGLITVIAVVPVVLYYTLKDYPFINRRLAELFPTVGGRRDYLVKAGVVVGNYLRGQLIISAIAAVNVTIGLLIFKVPFALVIGLLTGILNMIPNIGAVITNVIGIAIALVFGGFWPAVAVFGVLMAQSILEATILQPNIMSHQVGLHPVLIILALFVFGAFMGLLGLLIAVPATALMMAAYKAYRNEVQLELGALDHVEPVTEPERPSLTDDVARAAEGEPLTSKAAADDVAAAKRDLPPPKSDH